VYLCKLKVSGITYKMKSLLAKQEMHLTWALFSTKTWEIEDLKKTVLFLWISLKDNGK
jgi:hypothetical protein